VGAQLIVMNKLLSLSSASIVHQSLQDSRF
jgi:hypothetical protein